MAGFWSTLGKTLANTGAAYLQQVRLVNELKQLSPDEAHRRFAAFVQELSPTGRAGFSLTLTSLANAERDPSVKRWIESLRQGLTSSGASTPAPTAPPVKAATSPRVTASAARPSFEEDLERTADWFDIAEGEERARVALAYLAQLDVAGLRQLQTHVAKMQRNCAEKIQDHRDNEARIVAGRFIEDQHFYRLNVIRTGQHDPDWARQLAELERWGRWYDTLHEVVGNVIAERLAPPPPPPPPAPKLPTSTHQARSSGSTNRAERPRKKPRTTSAPTREVTEPRSPKDEKDVPEALLEGLRAQLQAQLATGEVQGERKAAFERALDQLSGLMRTDAGKGLGGPSRIQRIQTLFADLSPYLADPGRADRLAGAGPRARAIDRYAGRMKVVIGQDMMERPAQLTFETLGSAVGDVIRFQTELSKRPSDEDLLAQLETGVLRPAARTWHNVLQGRHALIARPLWESSAVRPEVNSVAVHAAADLLPVLGRALEPLRVTLHASTPLRHPGRACWQRLELCHVALFDLRGADAMDALVSRDPDRARELMGTAYAFGLAAALGKPSVVLANTGQRLPFDIDVAPVELCDDPGDLARVADAVDAAFYEPQRVGRDSSLDASVAFLRELTADHPHRARFEHSGWLSEALSRDPVGFAGAADQVLRQLDGPPWRVLHPNWPAAYPDHASRQCFHVMPYGPAWADAAREAAHACCTSRGWVYRRGKESDEGRIIHAIWDDICRAHLVLVDMTGANLNVMIELGMAHAVGRPVLAVARSETIDVRPPHVEKLRVHSWATAEQLQDVLGRNLD